METGGRWFKSNHPDQYQSQVRHPVGGLTVNELYVSSSLTLRARQYASLAQLIEHWIFNPAYPGLNPGRRTRTNQKNTGELGSVVNPGGCNPHSFGHVGAIPTSPTSCSKGDWCHQKYALLITKAQRAFPARVPWFTTGRNGWVATFES